MAEDFFSSFRVEDYREDLESLRFMIKDNEKSFFQQFEKTYCVMKSLTNSEKKALVTTREIDLYNFISASISNNVRGCIFDVGCWRGGISLILNIFLKKKYLDLFHRENLLFDTFDEYPESNFTHPVIQKSMNMIYQNTYHTCSEILDSYKSYQIEPDIEFCRGDLVSEVKKIKRKNIAVLIIDTGYFESVIASLLQFYPMVSKGGFVVVKDYFNDIMSCKVAVEKFIELRKIDVQFYQCEEAIFWRK